MLQFDFIFIYATVYHSSIKATKTLYESIEAASRGSGVSTTQIRRLAENECINNTFEFYIEGMNNFNI